MDKKSYTESEAAKLYEKYSEYEVDDMEMLETRIEEEYYEKRSEYMSQKLNMIKTDLLDQYRIEVDSEFWNDRLDCSFFIHPNMHERGLLCYFPTDSLSRGSHQLNLTKKRCPSCVTRELTIPFRIVK